MDIITDGINKYMNFNKQAIENDKYQLQQQEKFDNNKFSLEQTNNIFNKLYNFKYNELNIYKDLEVFKNYDNSNNKCVYNVINRTELKIGSFGLSKIINKPIKDYDKLILHNKILRNIDKKFNIISNKLLSIKSAEKDILWLLNKLDENEESIELYDTLYFQMSFLTFLNDNELFLNIYYIYVLYIIPLINVIMPALSYILPFILLKIFNLPIDHELYSKIFKNVVNINQFEMLNTSGGSMVKYGGIIFMLISYVQTSYFCYKDSTYIYNVSNIIHKKINNISKFIQVSIELNKLTNEIFDDKLLVNPLKELDDELFTNTEPHIFTNKGKILRVFKLITTNRYMFNDIILNTGKIDAYISILKLKRECNLNYPIYLDNNEPSLYIRDMFHPLLTKPIKNSVYLNKDKKHILLTGANGSGKSTYVKAIALNILLAQTIGLSFCSKIKFVPFNYINTYLNLADSIDKDSLFFMEMKRMKENLNIIEATDKPVFLAIDEIFSSTNPIEATCAGYAICKSFSKNKNLISIVSTHYKHLINLQKDTHNFINYKFMGNIINNNITYDYKLIKGHSSQSFALKILKQHGYDNEIIDCAEEVLAQIQSE